MSEISFGGIRICLWLNDHKSFALILDIGMNPVQLLKLPILKFLNIQQAVKASMLNLQEIQNFQEIIAS